MATLKIDNFRGSLTRYNFGDINSGFAKYMTTFANDPFTSPKALNWFEAPIRIDSGGTVITDLIMAGKERMEAGIAYVYAIGHTGRFYKIQVNDPTTYNPNYDNPVLLTTLTSGSPTFTRGASIDFFGTTEKVFIGHDKGVTKIDFDGTNETVIGVVGSWTQNVPRPSMEFGANIYYGNGSNIAEVNSTGTVLSYTKLSPAFPLNSQVRDIDVSSDGVYLEMVVARLALPDLTSIVQDTTLLLNGESYIFNWNGTDTGPTSYNSFPAFSLNSNITFGNKQFTFGYDLVGSAVYNPVDKILSPILSQAPLPNAVGSNGDILAWNTPEFFAGFTKASLFIYGSLDEETGVGWWRQVQMAAQDTETNVLRVPFSMIVSNLIIGPGSNGYAGGVAGAGKIYFSTLETSPSPTTKYKLYRYFPIPTGVLPSAQGVYETQTQILPSRVKIGEVRIYHAPLVANNSWQIDLIGIDGNPITNSTKTFSAGTSPVSVGDTRSRYRPEIGEVYGVGLRISNTGTTNMTFIKVEIDYEEVNG